MNDVENISFDDIELSSGGKKVVWEWIGEGWNGDFNPEDSDDVPLLRFSCYHFLNGDWQQMDDASYCTRMPISSNRFHLVKAAMIILEAIEDCNYKKRLEELSWFEPQDFIVDKQNA